MMLPIIKGNKLEGYLDSSKPYPPKFTETKDGVKINDKYEEWQVMDQTLMGWLYSSLSLDVVAQMINYNNSQELWKNVQDLQGARTKAKIMWYKNEIQITRKGSMKMRECLNKMKEYVDNLQLACYDYTLNDLFTQILSGLNSEYTTIVVTLSEKRKSYLD